jgi:hypothetical protein
MVVLSQALVHVSLGELENHLQVLTSPLLLSFLDKGKEKIYVDWWFRLDF